MLEELIRPFETRRIMPTTRIVSSSLKQDTQTATLTWGAAGTLPVAVADLPVGQGGVKVYQGDTLNQELSRVTEPVRIENPDDPTQYVMVDRVRSIRFATTPKTALLQVSTVDKSTGKTTTTSSGTSKFNQDFLLRGGKTATTSEIVV